MPGPELRPDRPQNALLRHGLGAFAQNSAALRFLSESGRAQPGQTKPQRRFRRSSATITALPPGFCLGSWTSSSSSLMSAMVTGRFPDFILCNFLACCHERQDRDSCMPVSRHAWTLRANEANLQRALGNIRKTYKGRVIPPSPASPVGESSWPRVCWTRWCFSQPPFASQYGSGCP